MAEGTGKVLYGIREIRVKNLLSTGAPDATATAYESLEPQECGLDPVYSEGEESENRGGDALVALVKEDDLLLGFDIAFRNAKLVPEICKTIAGGDLRYDTASPPVVIGWTTPISSDVQVPFEMTIWVANYTAGRQSTQDGFIKIFFSYCKGRLATKTSADREFTLEEFAIQARENPYDSAAPKYWEKVAAII